MLASGNTPFLWNAFFAVQRGESTYVREVARVPLLPGLAARLLDRQPALAAEHGVDVTNNSYYVDPWMFWCSNDPDQAAAKEAVRRAVSYSERNGVVSAAAAGNSNYDLANKTTDTTSPNDTTPVTRQIDEGCEDLPAELPGVVTVASNDQGSENRRR